MTRAMDSLLVGIDIGTQVTTCVVGELQPDAPLEVVAIGRAASRGISRGNVVDIAATVNGIREAVQQAEQMANCHIRSAYVAIGGAHIHSVQSAGSQALRGREVSNADVLKALESAKAMAIPADQRLLHVLPQEYAIDENDQVRFPVGMVGVRLEVRTHLVLAGQSAAQNLIKCLDMASIPLDELVYSGLASSLAVLTDDEKDRGVLLVDIGAGTCKMMFWRRGAPRWSRVLALGGDHVTNDIVVAFHTAREAAESLKIQYASARQERGGLDDYINVPGMHSEVAPRRLLRGQLTHVVRLRYNEICEMALAALEEAELDGQMLTSVVLTGGSARLDGLKVLAEEVFQKPVRIGAPIGFSGLDDVIHDPANATALGILRHGGRELGGGNPRWKSRLSPFLAKLGRLKTWFRGEFG